MKPKKNLTSGRYRGSVLLISMIFVIIFSALAVSIASLSDSNIQIYSSQQKINSALVSAQSGLEILRYYLSSTTISGADPAESRLQTVASTLQSRLETAGIINIIPSYNSATKVITIPDVTISSQSNQTFNAVINYGDNFDILQVTVTGNSQEITRKIKMACEFSTFGSNVFNFGIASKGPLRMQGNVDVEGLNEIIEAEVYIESENYNEALSMEGKSEIAGDVSIVNPIANVSVGESSSIGGESGQDGIDNHVKIGVDPIDFPEPDPTAFEQYVESALDPETDTTTNLILENIRIPANTNPHFSGNVIINGIMYIEAPNIVKFTGNVNITGIIVAEGDLESPSIANQLIFGGNVSSQSVSQLPAEERFNGIKQETGTFLLAPGFHASFGGDFDTLNGVIAASGIAFYGNAGGTINGSVVNYGDTPMTLNGNTGLVFNRSGIDENPAGFIPNKVIKFLPGTYSEPLL